MSDILCPTDLSDLGRTALAHARQLADRTRSSVTLLHVRDTSERKGARAEEVQAMLNADATGAPGASQVNTKLRDGNFLKEIQQEAAEGHTLMVAGTHGPRGLRQNLFGADILQLVRHIPIPSWIMQSASPVRSVDRLVMPVAGHADITGLLSAITLLARAFGSEVHVFQLMRPGESPSDQLLQNKLKMLHHLAEKGIAHLEVNEPSVVYSIGFAEQTIQYARKVDAQGIAIMATASDDYRYIADAEKERLLMNDATLPVLCSC
ncbi:MAG: universal stress protein [Flavobacteriales bacterium]|nr:universal stress protein [Flavobacteriales bacterium]MBP6696914.1 universal stress protein [Flavobacteriales bacterium]